MPSKAPIPRDFLCEHTPTKSRVFAVLASPGGPNTLKAVFTCTDSVLAQRAASVLAALAQSGSGEGVDADAEEIAVTLPAAPAASFRETCRRLRDQEWPVADTASVGWSRLQPTEEEETSARQDEELRTPSDARLGQLSGKVFRIIQLLEYHVHDAGRLLTAATADGWSSLSDEEGQADPNDLLDAVMYMADISREMPGADITGQRGTGEELIAAEGDELADWQQGPVIAEFGSGWRLQSEEIGQHEEVSPDFATLFSVQSCDLDHANEDEEERCEVCGRWQLTPRTADILYTALENLSDEAYNDVDERADEPVEANEAGNWSFFGRFPRVTWGMDAEWRRQASRACEDLSDDLAAGKWPHPRCTAEEMALHLAIRDAPGYLEMCQEAEEDHHEALPSHPDDYDWGMCSEVLFQDHDVLMLFNPGLDGIEDPGDDLNRDSGMGDLRATAWFTFFNNLEPRDPNRGFRR